MKSNFVLENECTCVKEKLNTKEAAEFLRMSPRSLEGMRSDGIGPRYAKLGNGPKAKVIYLRSDLREWRDSMIVTPQRKFDDKHVTYSNDPRDYSKEHLERALLVAAEMAADGMPTWPFELLEDALALHEKDDVRTRAQKYAARRSSVGLTKS